MATYEHSSIYQLFNASKTGELSTLKRLVENENEAETLVWQVDDQGRTALHYAKNRSVAKFLLDVIPRHRLKEYLRIKSDVVRPRGRQGPSWQLSVKALEPSEKIKSLSSTALDCAAVDCKLDVVEYICSLISPHELVVTQSPLHLAASTAVAKVLAESVPANEQTSFLLSKNEKGQTALHFAVKFEISDVVKYLCDFALEQLALSQDEDGNTALHLARNECDASSIVESFHDPVLHNTRNNRGETALHMATRENRIEVVSYLCTISPDSVFFCQDNSGSTALHLAKSEELVESLVSPVPTEYLEKYMLHVDHRRMTALLRSVYWGSRFSVIESLLKSTHSKDKLLLSCDVEGRTALHYARSEQLVEILLDAVEDTVGFSKVQDKDGNTALTFLTLRAIAEPMQCLLDRLQSKLDDQEFTNFLLIVNSRKQNVLHLASISPLSNQLIEIFADYVSNEDMMRFMYPDTLGNTPLIYLAAKFATESFASLLMMLPLWSRRRLLKHRNAKGLDCETLAASNFQLDTYLQEVLGVDKNITYREFFQSTLLSGKFHIEQLCHPEKYITHDPQLMKVLKYSLNEYGIPTPLALKDLLQSVDEQPSLQQSAVTAAPSQEHYSQAIPCYLFNMEILGLSDINKKLYEVDNAENSGLPKVIFVHTSTKQVRFVSPPGPDFIIITVVSDASTGELLENVSHCGVQQAIDDIRKLDSVEFVNVNSTLSKHLQKSSDVLPTDATLLPITGTDKGIGLVISFACNREGYELEQEAACRLFQEFGLQVTVAKDMNSEAMLREITTFASLDHGAFTAVAIMSHGDEQGNILASDPQDPVPVQKVVDSLCQKKIHSVVKFLFLSFSRGTLGRPRHNRVSKSWECTTLPSLSSLMSFNAVRQGVNPHMLEEVRRHHPFPSIHPPENCYILFSTLPDSGSLRYNSRTGETNKMFSALYDYLAEVREMQTLSSKGADSGASAASGSGAADGSVSVELTSYLTDVTALVRQTSAYTQHLNYSYTLTKDTKPVYLQVPPLSDLHPE